MRFFEILLDAGAQTDAKGQITETQTDAAGRTIRKTTYGPGGSNVTFSYGEQRTGYFNTGRLTTMTDAYGTEQYDYDALGRQVRQSRVLDGVTYTLQRRYSTSGHLTGITWPDSDAFGTTAAPITYDAAGRLKTVPGFVTDAVYDALGRPKWRYQANGTTTFWDFDERGTLRRIQTTSTGEPGGLIQDLQYTPDVLGRVQSVSSPFPYESWSYGYDLLGRLTTATNLYDPAQSQGFQYDIVGNKTWDSRIGAITYPLPGSTRPHAPASVAGQAMVYDLNGNLLSGRGRTYEWNVENKPTLINGVSFTYAGDGTRLKKTAPGGTTLYPLGDDYEIRGSEVTKYLRLGGVLIGKRVGAANRWLHVDRLGSVQVVTDGAGLNTLRRSYRPYGQKIADSTTHWEPLGYIGQRLDEETGLTYLHARYYDSEVGVFVSPDSLDADQRGVGPARYAYSHGDPANLSDPSGQKDGYTCIGEYRDHTCAVYFGGYTYLEALEVMGRNLINVIFLTGPERGPGGGSGGERDPKDPIGGFSGGEGDGDTGSGTGCDAGSTDGVCNTSGGGGVSNEKPAESPLNEALKKLKCELASGYGEISVSAPVILTPLPGVAFGPVIGGQFSPSRGLFPEIGVTLGTLGASGSVTWAHGQQPTPGISEGINAGLNPPGSLFGVAYQRGEGGYFNPDWGPTSPFSQWGINAGSSGVGVSTTAVFDLPGNAHSTPNMPSGCEK